jgi:hypothetical protein
VKQPPLPTNYFAQRAAFERANMGGVFPPALGKVKVVPFVAMTSTKQAPTGRNAPVSYAQQFGV